MPRPYKGLEVKPQDSEEIPEIYLQPRERRYPPDLPQHVEEQVHFVRAEESSRSNEDYRASFGMKLSAGIATAFGAIFFSIAVVMALVAYALFTDGIRAQYSATYDLMAVQQEQIRELVEPLAQKGGYSADAVMRAIAPEEIRSFSHDRVEWIWQVVLQNETEGQPVWDDTAIISALENDTGLRAASGEELDKAVEKQAALIVGAIDQSVMPMQSVGDKLFLFMGNFISDKQIVMWFLIGLFVMLALGLCGLMLPLRTLSKYRPYPSLYLGCGLISVGIILEVTQALLNRETIARIMNMLGEQIKSVLGACVAWIMDALALGGLIVLLFGAAIIVLFIARRYQIRNYTHHELSRHQF